VAEPTTILAIASLIIGVGTQQMAQRKQEKAQEAQTRIRGEESRRARLKEIRQSRIATAQIQAGAAATGTLNSSSAAGGVAGVQSSAASNISFINGIENIQDSVSSRLRSANRFSSYAQAFTQLGNLALQQSSPATPSQVQQPSANAYSSASGSNMSQVSNTQKPWLNAAPTL